MGIFSGSNRQDPNGRLLLDLIACSDTDRRIRHILNIIAQPKIGEICYTANLSKPVQGNIYSKNDIPENFDGWVYANGKFISKALFPEMTDLLRDIDYAGKQETETRISLPIITKFFRLNPGNTSISGYSEEKSEYAMPEHTHALNNTNAPSDVKTLQRCAFIWLSPSGTSEGRGKMPFVDGSQFSFGDVTYENGIPSSPSVCKGDSHPAKFDDGSYAYTKWDIPLDTNYIKNDIHLICQTGVESTNDDVCYPAYVKAPVLIYIGKAG